MRESRFVLILFVLLSFGVSLVVPAEDDPETPYDESQELPFEVPPAYSTVVLLEAAGTTKAMANYSHHKLGAPSPLSQARVRDSDCHRSTDSRLSLAIICTLRC